MPGDGERAESSQVSSVFQRYQAERDDDEQDGFFVHVPAEEEGGVCAEGSGCDEVGPGGAEEEFDECGLGWVVSQRRDWVGRGEDVRFELRV